MSYQSLSFLFFTAVVLLIYYLAGKKRQLWVLGIANLVFYLFAGVKYLPFILVTLVTTFLCAKKITKIYTEADVQISECNTPEEKKEKRNLAKKNAKKYLLVSLFISIGLLIVCKYTLFLLNNVNEFLSFFGSYQIPTFNMIMPLGISFYTFMAISYVLDIYWKRYTAENNFLLYAVYLSYFPHVVQGPIDRFNEFKDQVKNGKSFHYQNITYGAQLALWGFFKKLVIADRIAILVNESIGNYEEYDGSIIIFALIVYSIQIYADFSGCIDIVSGISEMFGIKLRQNFNHPYFSQTMGEFWRRWHISLQEWFKDYIYFPVSSSERVKKIKKNLKLKGKVRLSEIFTSCFPILVVWLVTGLWHGADWKYVIWGLFHAFLLIGSKIFENVFIKVNVALRIKTDTWSWKLWRILRTFILCCIGRIFFRADNIAHANNLIKAIILNTHFEQLLCFDFTSFGFSTEEIFLMWLSILILIAVDFLQEKMCIREELHNQNTLFRWIIIFMAVFAVIILGKYGPGYDASAFIYEQF